MDSWKQRLGASLGSQCTGRSGQPASQPFRQIVINCKVNAGFFLLGGVERELHCRKEVAEGIRMKVEGEVVIEGGS